MLVLTETPHEAVEALLDFMYLGKADLSPDDLDELLDVAYEFKIRGLISPKDDPERQVCTELSLKFSCLLRINANSVSCSKITVIPFYENSGCVILPM